MKRPSELPEVQIGDCGPAEWLVGAPPIPQKESAFSRIKDPLPRTVLRWAFWAILVLLLPAAIDANPDTGSPSRMIINESPEFEVGPFLETLEDSKQNLDYETVRSLDASHFKPADSLNSLNLGFQHSDYWGRVDLENRSKKEHFFFSHPISLTDHLEIWFKTRAGTTHLKSGDIYPFSEKTVPYYGHAFRLDLPPGETGQLVIRMHTTSAIWFSFGLETEDSFLASQEQDYLLLGGYAGLMAVMIVYNLVMFFSIRDGSFLTYIIYILLFALSQLALKGIGAQYIWGEWPLWNNYSFLVLVGLASAALLIFSVQFLNLSQYLPGMRYFLLGLAIVALPASLLPFLTGYATAVRIVNIYALILPVLVICIAIWIARKGYVPAQYYIFAFLFFFAGAMIFSAAARGWLPANIWTANAMLSGSAVQVVLLSLGLGSR
ncbi:MAG: hypothetical protein KDK33_18585, partial [Leptospiraceae bacterium]|nr:hypothetical protein [Leptospiraceae bacterium]